MSHKPLFSSKSRLANKGIWKAGSLASNPERLKAFVTWKHGADVERCHNKSPWRPQTKTSTVLETSLWQAWVCHELLGSREDSKCGRRIFTAKNHSNPSLIHNSEHRPWQCSSWIATPDSIIHPYQLSELLMSWMSLQGMDSWNKHVEQTSFRQCVTFCEKGQLKGWQPHFQPTVAKSWISTIFHWLAAVASIRPPRSQWISCNPKLGYHNTIFCKRELCCRSQGPQASGRKWRLRFHKRHGFLRQTCRINLFSVVRHI